MISRKKWDTPFGKENRARLSVATSGGGAMRYIWHLLFSLEWARQRATLAISNCSTGSTGIQSIISTILKKNCSSVIKDFLIKKRRVVNLFLGARKWLGHWRSRSYDRLHPGRRPNAHKYVNLFREMMARLVTLQGQDGLWRSSVNDPAWYPMPETSGSGFFVFALAAGINRGWLDEKSYRQAAEKGWEGLVSTLSPQGKVQWSQPVSAQPYATRKEQTRSYTQGIFLLAASEMYQLAGHSKLEPQKPVAKTFARYVPERIDDFAWENDKTALRAYGPKARKGSESAGSIAGSNVLSIR